jgi:secreted PhoX family phosphatase
VSSKKLTTQSNHFDAVLQEALSSPLRRKVLKGSLGVSALSFLGLAGCGGGGSTTAAAPSSAAGALSFNATPLNQTYDGVSVAEGYQVELLYKLGDPINAATPAYLNNGTETSASYDFRAGDHHDGMYYFGMGANNKWDKKVSDKGMLCINHEAITPLFLHANGPTPASGNRTVVDEVQKEFRLHGVSVVEVVKTNGKFAVNTASPLNRRITTLTPMEINGPLRGNNLMKTKYSPTGVRTRGTVNNCASGYTPWGTYLTCEENWYNYFRRENTTGRSANDLASEQRYSLSGSNAVLGRERWSTVDPGDEYARWNMTISGATATDDYRYAANTFGFNVEIDPFDVTSVPRKRTAMGRFGHEGAWVGPVTEGKPLVFYMGCDAVDEYIYKFVSTENWRASDINGGLTAGDRYLDSGKLYVAKFNSNFTGEWLELTSGLSGTQAVSSGPTAQTFTFGDSTDAYLNTRIAADKKGGTKMDRPEWGAVNPRNGEVYFTMTKNAGRTIARTDEANPRSYKDNSSSANGNPNGHIIRFRENGSNPTATAFEWDVYAFGAESDDLNNANVNLSGLTAENFFSAPDGLWFSEKTGIMYIQTDDGDFTNETDGKGSTCMLLAAIPGTVGDGKSVEVTNVDGTTSKTVITKVGKVGQLKRMLTGPIDCEITGITESYDGKALFVNIQHPGENTALANIASPLSSWPYSASGNGNPATPTAAKSGRPRSATIVITRVDGGVVGGDFSL